MNPYRDHPGCPWERMAPYPGFADADSLDIRERAWVPVTEQMALDLTDAHNRKWRAIGGERRARYAREDRNASIRLTLGLIVVGGLLITTVLLYILNPLAVVGL